MRRCYPFVVVLLAGCAGSRAHTANIDGAATTACEAAATILISGPDSTSSLAARRLIRACPVRAGELLAPFLRESRAMTNLDQLDVRTRSMQYLHDAQLLAAGIEVATDTLAAPEARVAALRVMLWTKAPGHAVTMRDMIGSDGCGSRACLSSYTNHFFGRGPFAGDTTSSLTFGEPMSPGYVAQIDSVAQLVAIFRSNPDIVQRAARVVLRYPTDDQLGGR